MPSTFFFVAGTVLLSLNFVRPFGLAISDWLYFGALGFAFIETFSIQRFDAPCWWRNRFLWPVSLILFGAIVSTINSQNWVVAIIEIIQQIFVLTLFISMVWILVRRGKITTIIYAFILSGAFTAGVVLVDKFTGSRFGPILSGTPDVQLWGRFAGALGHPNKLGYFLVLTTLLSIGQLLNPKASGVSFFYRLMWCALILVQGFGIYLSGSMTAYLGLLVGMVVFALSSSNILVRMTIVFGILAAGFILSLWLIPDTHLSLSDSLPELNNNFIAQALTRVVSTTAETRLQTYVQAWDEIVQNPWFGVGYDQMSTSGISTESRYLEYSVHNPLTQIWYTGGLFAFLGWLAIYICVGWMALDILRRGKNITISMLMVSLASASLAILLMDQFQDGIYQREKWLVIGLLVGLFAEKNRFKAPSPDYANSQQEIKHKGVRKVGEIKRLLDANRNGRLT